MDTSRNIVLALLVVAIAVAVFYMIDPTLGGLLGRKARYENFQDAVLDRTAAASSSGEVPTMRQNGKAEKDTVMSAQHVASQPVMAPSTPQGTESHAGVTEGFQTLQPSPMPFPEADKPANCYPKNQLTPQELLPNDPNSKWAQVNPMGQGDISGKNFLNAGSLIGVNTVGQSLRNANQGLRSEPPCPQTQVSIWMQSTIEPDLQRKPLEGF